MDYKHTQTGYLFLFVLLWMVGVTALIAAFADDERAASLFVMGISTLVVLLVTFWFSRLTVRVGAGEIRVGFGPGWPRRVFGSHEIVGFRQVRNKWYYGWGVRGIPGGWMFSVWGLDAVELELASGRKFRIGTNEPEDLLAALSAHTAIRPG